VYEILQPVCISNELLQRSDVILNINHSTKVTDVLGRCNNGNGTLELELRDMYVAAGCELPQTNTANDTLELIKRGDISGMSFAFEDDWEDTENGVSLERTNEVEDGKEVWLRHVKKITGLYDVAIVTHPAYEQTTVGLREASEAIDKAIEAQLKRECGGGDDKDEENDKRGCGDGKDDQKRDDNPDDKDDIKDDDPDDKDDKDDAEEQAKREQEEREARELEEQEQRFREQQAMRLRYQARRLNDEILESLNY
jgi:HK97 family phage prohead protease